MTIKYCDIHEDVELWVSPCGLSLICYECAEGPQQCHCGKFHSPEDYVPVDMYTPG